MLYTHTHTHTHTHKLHNYTLVAPWRTLTPPTDYDGGRVDPCVCGSSVAIWYAPAAGFGGASLKSPQSIGNHRSGGGVLSVVIV